MKTSNGFTLLEVMIALAIFAIAMSSLMSAMNASTHNLTGLQNRTIAQWIASNRLVGFESTGNYPKQGEKFEKITYGGVGKPREWVIRIQFDSNEMIDKNMRHLVVSAGEELNGEKQFYATVDTFVNIAK